MRKYLTLTNVLLKCGFQMTDGKSKKWFKLFLYVVLAISFLPMLGLLYFTVDALLPLYSQIDQSALMMGVMLFLACILIFIFSLFLIPSIFYFSSDLEILLALPLKSIHIIGAKFTVCVLYEYLFAASILVPTYAAYLHQGNIEWSFLPLGIIVMVLLPIFPLVLSTLFTILLMRFVPFFKNRDRFNLISSILVVGLGMSFSFFMNSLGTQSESELLQALMSGGSSLLSLFMKLFPSIPYFARALVEGNLWELFIGIVITLLALIVLLSMGKFLYFKGAIGSGETSASHKQLSERKLKQLTHRGNKKWTYLKKDFKVLLRTPAYFTNCLLMVIIFPILMLVFPLLNQQDGLSAFDFNTLILYLQRMDHFIAYVIWIALGTGFLFGIFNQISATAISREGSQYTVMKYIPMSYRNQIHAKLLLGVLAGVIGNVAMAAAMSLLVPFAWYYYVLYCLISTITTLLINALAIMLDLAKPKLVWEQEAAAVKQNLGTFVALMLGMALCIVTIVTVFFIPQEWLMISAIIALATTLPLAIGAYVLAGSYAERAMRKL